MPIRGMLRFADAVSDFNESQFVIVGAPFDKTTTYRSGARFAPTTVRETSQTFERRTSSTASPSKTSRCTTGGTCSRGTVDEMVSSIGEEAKRIVSAKKFPIFIGESTRSRRPWSGVRDVSVITIDAHLDFREEYQGLKNSHACAHRRIVDHVGKGTRSHLA